VKFLCDQCKTKYQIADEKVAGKTVRMKCRKCGHAIEVRAAVTETSVSNRPPPADGPVPDVKPGAPKAPAGTPPRPPPKAAPPRASPFATSLAAAKPAAPRAPEKPGALAGAFKSSVQKEETSAPFDLAELSAADEWYVAINGVPVGPIRIAEVRRKAALGAVIEDSLCWQEGLEEWRPVRAFAELAAVVREAALSGRSSLLSPAPPEARGGTSAPPARARMSGVPPRAPAAARPATSAPTPAPARSNVVPIMSRLATAEKLDAEPENDKPVPYTGLPIGVADPFAPSPATGAAAMASGLQPSLAQPSLAQPTAAIATPIVDTAAKRPPPWIAIAMIVLAAAFGAVAAFAIFFRPQPQVPPPVIVQVPGVPTTTGTETSSTAGALPQADTARAASGGSPKTGPAIAAAGATAPKASSNGGGGLGLDLRALHGGGPSVSPTDEPGESRAPGQCFSEGQVQSIIGAHQLAIRRSCWERNPTNKPTVSVSVTMTIGPGGEVQSVSASGDEPSVAKCIENDVRGWHFPAMGCSQKTNFSFKFVRQ
jgi:predicted Zn finger-like uncharacterized protein